MSYAFYMDESVTKKQEKDFKEAVKYLEKHSDYIMDDSFFSEYSMKEIINLAKKLKKVV